MVLWNSGLIAPQAAPGAYQVRLVAAGQSATAPFTVRRDPRSHSTDADLEAQTRFLLGIRDEIDLTHDALRRIRAIRAQLTDLGKRLRAATAERPDGDGAATAAAGAGDGRPETGAATAAPDAGANAYAGVRARRQRTSTPSWRRSRRPSTRTRATPPRTCSTTPSASTTSSTAWRSRRRSATTARPPRPSPCAMKLVAAIDAQLARLGAILEHEVPAFNQLAAGAGVQPVIPPLRPQLK